MSASLYLNEYEDDGEVKYCWCFESWSSQEFRTKEGALNAWNNKELLFSQPDYYSPVEAATVNTIANHDQNPPYDYWLVESAIVVEAGTLIQLGKVQDYKIPEGSSVLHITQEQFEMMMEELCAEGGDVPE